MRVECLWSTCASLDVDWREMSTLDIKCGAPGQPVSTLKLEQRERDSEARNGMEQDERKAAQ